jgi:methionyl-tRNA synthetase
LHEGLQAVWRMVSRGNEYVDRQAPWKQAKDPAQSAALDETLASLVRQLARFAVLLFPYLPEKSINLWRQLGGPGDLGAQRLSDLMALDPTGWNVAKGESLFPKEVKS